MQDKKTKREFNKFLYKINKTPNAYYINRNKKYYRTKLTDEQREDNRVRIETMRSRMSY